MVIRPYEQRDWESVWAILEPAFRAGETYAFPVDISEEDARCAWTDHPKLAFVAVDPVTERVVGTYYLKPNQDGPGANVCNCGYVVSVSARGKGVATLMCEHSQTEAVSRGYRAMQFNLVAASNESAVRLWKKLGYEIVRTLPGAFPHRRLGFVDAHVMYKCLEGSDAEKRDGEQRMNVRFEEPEDQESIRAVHTASFPTPGEARLVDALRRSGRLLVSLVAEEQRRVVGHVAFSPVTVPGATDGVGLAPVAVLPAFRRRGIAARLIREGLGICEQSGHGFVVVLGEPRYYSRFGFLPASGWRLQDEYGGGNAFQVLELRPRAIPLDGGFVEYAPEFATVVPEEKEP